MAMPRSASDQRRNMSRGAGQLLVMVGALVVVALVQLQSAAAQSTCSSTKPCSGSNCCSQYNYCGTSSAHCGTGCKSGPCTGKSPPKSPPSSGGSHWTSFLTKSVFEGFFPNRVGFYTYEKFASAAKSYPNFGNTGSSVTTKKRELAAFLANVNLESGGLKYINEINPTTDYCQPDKQYPCASGKKYYGRGPMQLSYNYNYGECGNDLKLALLTNPDLVAQSGTTAFKTALWFWMKRGCHAAITGNSPSFGKTIKIINGLECGHGTDARVENRVKYYLNFCQKLGVSPGSNLRC